MTNIVVLNNRDHRDLKILDYLSAPVHIFKNAVCLYPDEYQHAALNQAILFSKDKNTGQFKSIVLFGIETNENLYVDLDNNWEDIYIPMELMAKPFSYVSDENNQPLLSLDLDCEYLNDTNGAEIYHTDGKPTDRLLQVASVIKEIIRQQEILDRFISTLMDLELIEACNINVTLSNEKKISLQSLYILNRDKLARLDHKSYQCLKENGLTSYIDTILNSEKHISSLIERTNTRLNQEKSSSSL